MVCTKRGVYTWCDDINGLVAKYWWGQTKEKRKIHWMKWKKLCTTKGDGGWAFEILFISICLSWLSKVEGYSNSHSLFHKVFKAKYFSSCSFLEANAGSNPSYTWKSILVGQNVLLKGID